MINFKNPSIPLYYQLENILRERIISGEYRPGDFIETEEALVRSYNVSRITVRKALLALKNDKLIISKRKVGSFVSKKPVSPIRMKLTGEIEDIIAKEAKSRAKVIYFNFISAPKKIIEILNLDENVKPLKIERIRVIRGSPLTYSINYLPPDLGKRIRAKDLTFHPIYHALEKRCKEKIGRGIQIVEATIADSRIASFLKVMIGAPLLKIERTIFNTKGRPLNYVTVLYRADRYHFAVNLIRGGQKLGAKWDYKKP